MTTAPPATDQWATEFTQVCNQDDELAAHGKHFSCAFQLVMGERTFLIVMHRGKVEDILVDPGPLDERYQFQIRASADTWREFGKKEPRAMCHGIWAATFREDMKLEGDLLVLMQNLRCITRQLELLRITGVPV